MGSVGVTCAEGAIGMIVGISGAGAASVVETSSIEESVLKLLGKRSVEIFVKIGGEEDENDERSVRDENLIFSQKTTC